jgi:hypothetical protein
MTERERKEVGINAGREIRVNFEQVSTETLITDTQSVEAYQRRREWEQNRAKKELILLDTCSDSRIITPNPKQSVVIRSISAGRDLEPFSPLLKHPSVKAIHILGHHAGIEVIDGEAPRGCGGLAVKEKQLQGSKAHSDVEKWVAKNVCHSDSLLVAIDKAKQALLHTNKDTLVSTEDHLDGSIFPMLLIKDTNFGIRNYDPSYTYSNGIPVLPSEQIDNSPFADYLNEYYEKQFPELFYFSEHNRKSLEVQNPHMLMITTNIRPPEVCYPQTTGKPNTVFVETLARTKNRALGDKVEIQPKDIENVIDQAEYPVSHFSNLKTVYIETGDIDQSRRVATKMFERPWFVQWFGKENKKIIVSATRAGLIEEIYNFRPQYYY